MEKEVSRKEILAKYESGFLELEKGRKEEMYNDFFDDLEDGEELEPKRSVVIDGESWIMSALANGSGDNFGF